MNRKSTTLSSRPNIAVLKVPSPRAAGARSTFFFKEEGKSPEPTLRLGSENKADPFVQESLSRPQLFKDYERAFGEATGLPLTLSPVNEWHLAHRGQNKSCAACLRVQRELATETTSEARTTTCFAGLRETAVPVRIGNQIIGFLRTGEVLLQKPAAPQFARVAGQLRDWGFHQAAGCTFTQYLARVRVEAAKKMLSRSRTSTSSSKLSPVNRRPTTARRCRWAPSLRDGAPQREPTLHAPEEAVPTAKSATTAPKFEALKYHEIRRI